MTQKKRTPFRPAQNRAEDALPRRAHGQGFSEHQGLEARQDGPRSPGTAIAKNRRAAQTGEGAVTHPDSAQPNPDTHTDKLHKVLAQAGLGSRRDMEAAIVAGRVSVNGKPAQVGARVGPSDRILFDGRPIPKHRPDALPRILLYHKPEGEIVSRDDPEARETVFDKLPRVRGGKWISIGRLDYNTSGLLIFTTSGELANRLSHPRFEVEREYAVRVMGELSKEQCATLCEGVELTDGPAKFEWLRDEGGEGSNHWYRVMLKEGRNREVRRLFEAMNVMVSRLMRVRFGIINLPPRLKRGEFSDLDETEVKTVLAWAGIAPVEAAPAAAVKREPRPPRERRPAPRNPRAGQTRSRVRQGRR